MDPKLIFKEQGLPKDSDMAGILWLPTTIGLMSHQTIHRLAFSLDQQTLGAQCM
jgi:hypothetical protein